MASIVFSSLAKRAFRSRRMPSIRADFSRCRRNFTGGLKLRPDVLFHDDQLIRDALTNFEGFVVELPNEIGDAIWGERGQREAQLTASGGGRLP